MNLKIVYDNEAKPGFEKGWGFSCVIELEDEKILFDTGWDGGALLSNMGKLEVHRDEINRVVLSHSHWDHIGGLPHLRGKEMQVYVPRSFSKRLRGEIDARFELHEVEAPQRVREGVWTTGELGGDIKEQSLAVESREGLVVITGCSHPGVRDIFSAASEFGGIWGIVGGMHDFDELDLLDGLGLIVPSHCTDRKEEIARRFPGSYIKSEAGRKIELE